MENCETYLEWISAHLDGQLSDEEERELEEHLDQCPTCRAIEERLAALHDSFQGLEDIPAPEGFTQGVMDRVRAEQSRPKVVPLFKRPQFKALAGLAACAALCIGLYRGGLWDRAADNQLSVASATDLWQEEPQVNISLFEADDPQSAESENSGAEGQERSEPGGQTDISPYGAELDESAQSPAPDSGVSPDLRSESREQEPSDVGASKVDALERGVPEENVSGNGTPSMLQTAPGPMYEVGGKTVAAVLTLDRLPEGWEDVLGETPEWLTDEAGRPCCFITAAQLEGLAALAQQEESGSALAGQTDQDQLCALVLLEGQ